MVVTPVPIDVKRFACPCTAGIACICLEALKKIGWRMDCDEVISFTEQKISFTTYCLQRTDLVGL